MKKQANGTMRVESIPVAKLNPAPYNPRKISDDAMARLEKSIEKWGLVDPLIWNKRTGTLIGGHQRLKVLRKRGIAAAECVVVDLPLSREKALNVALNNQKMAGEYDFTMLADLLQEIDTGEFSVPDLTGFSEADLEEIAAWTPTNDGEETQPVPEPPVEAVTRTGDIWELGKHRLMCGDSTKTEDVVRLMGGAKAMLMNSDPPYGVSYANDDRPNPGVAKPRVAKDEFRDEELQRFLEAAFKVAVSSALLPNAAWYLWHAHLTQGFFAAAAAAADVLLHRQIIWVKPVLLLTRGQYHWKHEPCFMGWVRGKEPPDYGRGDGERDQTTVWEIGTVSQQERKEFNHATPKPVELFTIPIAKHTKQGQVVYEPFAGSGPQIMAAEKLGRCCYAMEIEPRYVDVSVKRWQNFTDKQAKNLTRKGVGIG